MTDEPGRFNLVSNVILFFILIGLAAICIAVAHPVITNSGFKPLEMQNSAPHTPGPTADKSRSDSGSE